MLTDTLALFQSISCILVELDELDGYNINDLGNWNVDIRRDVYSAKLPMKAMRVMAGHPDEKGIVFCHKITSNLQ